ncbi:unnamed protein product [Toxocara canis]|uniref:Uncharacterized protein n=1 Tax=Toxocara canis TaxID=6265 RepID=A0A3P7FYN6_TOXCA|nr:unnamed protein product [Toxocara canis]
MNEPNGAVFFAAIGNYHYGEILRQKAVESGVQVRYDDLFAQQGNGNKLTSGLRDVMLFLKICKDFAFVISSGTEFHVFITLFGKKVLEYVESAFLYSKLRGVRRASATISGGYFEEFIEFIGVNVFVNNIVSHIKIGVEAT